MSYQGNRNDADASQYAGKSDDPVWLGLGRRRPIHLGDRPLAAPSCDGDPVTARPHTASITSAKPAPLHVIIIGGGIGGLTLAQGLKKSGISFAVYERDRAPTDRVQGYRVHINPTGSAALHECLPPHLFDTFVRTCGKPSQSIHFVTERMKVLFALDELNARKRFGGVAQHRSVSRITLRQVLLAGLDDVVHFGRTFTRYEEAPTGGIVAHFEDGTAAEGDVLVAADGGGSRVRQQFLPHAERIDTGFVGIAGKVFLDNESRSRIAPLLGNGMTLASGKGGYCLFVALQEIGGAAANDLGGNAAPVADVHFDNSRSYLMWAFGARREKLGLAGRDIGRMSGGELRSIALGIMGARSWDERFQTLVCLANADTINALAIRTSVPIAAWQTRRVTLLGDAIHSMTPYRGIGANVALKDAKRLRDALAVAVRGNRPLLDAIHDYESDMVAYGFRAVRTSLQAMNQAMVENPLQLALSRAALRIIDRVPAFRQWMFNRIGEE
jgi:2-polyprenyl-6-methoxyphenol hydroxylase-like FAD-dependent oxidoreductase